MAEYIEALKEAVLQTAKKMYASGLVKGTSGNVSARVPEEGYILITPTGIPYEDMERDDIVLVDEHGAVVEGFRKPSSEVPMHTRVYRDHPWVQGIVHTHSLFATTFAVLGETIPAVHYLIASMGTTIPVASYATYGTEELAAGASRTIGPDHKGILLQNHGVLAAGTSLDEAYQNAATVEFLAELYYRTRSIGRPILLSDEEIARVAEKLKKYGQEKS
ncbi:class II aldolase/adducin family protein [Kyrpidia sp.]|uniref:class II aldolase/adducin family protein n=1 Tax=Kyrpidia sp. TaxID=2073077 RepID=UPI00179974D1|nr:class II aldolase/adducin family protein [Kyrpidia sp.]MCL6575004.1 class II aldolase/adducin family protein [Kyrpidia sp.]HHY66192.1 hypothetical protein [Alicyclobacillus sp.]